MTRPFHELAESWGIETSYTDSNGNRCDAKPEVLKAVLDALDVSSKPQIQHVDHPKKHSVLTACTPPPGERRWGVFLPVYALNSKRSWGAGDFTDLGHLTEWVGGLGGGIVGTLPLLASFLSEPFAPCPYTPASRLFWNEFFIDPEKVPGFVDLPQVETVSRQRDELRRLPLVDYKETMGLKRRLLERLAEDFFSGTNRRREEFDRFSKERPQVEDYARFRASQEGNDGAARYHQYVQWIADRQLARVAESARKKGVRLYLDFPVGVHAKGYDLWHYRNLFVPGISIGAPPDAFFTGGQNWGFPPLHPFRLNEGGLDYLTQCLRHHLRYAGVLRIDHVMSLHRLFWIPDGFDAKDGVYVRYPADLFYRLVCEESRRSGALIVGEDLGTIPPEVRPTMKRHHLLRSFVLEFEKDRPTLSVPRLSVASLNTHDLPPFAATCDPAVDAKPALRRNLNQLAKSKAALVMVNLEDLWLEMKPQNVPGTTEEHPNWRRKARLGLEEFRADHDVLEILREVDRLRRRTS